MDTQLTPLEQVNADRKQAVVALLPLLDAVVDSVRDLDPELFYGGLPQSLNQVEMMMENAKNSLMRSFNITAP